MYGYCGQLELPACMHRNSIKLKQREAPFSYTGMRSLISTNFPYAVSSSHDINFKKALKG